MNSRERLLDIVIDIGTGPDDGALVDINAEDAAALRELDQLLIDLVEQAKFLQGIESILGHTGFDELLVRAARAGYGEK